LVFRLKLPTLLRITVVRVYPSCRHFGSFTVRGRAGLNRIRFRGRLGGRTLPAGGYRLIVRVRGATRDAAAVPIVIARRPLTPAAVRKVRTASVCSEPVADFDSDDTLAAGNGGAASTGGALGTIKERITGPLGSAAGAIGRTARGLTERVEEASDNPLRSPFILTLIGGLALASAILGAIVFARIARAAGFRNL
jgi:hypothetical protein